MTTASLAERAGLLRAVCERPADDGPRLVYADWLEDNGEGERAEFIRVQVELAGIGRMALPDGTWGMRTGCAEDDVRELMLYRRERRERQLVARHWMRWGLELPGPWMPHGVASDEARMYSSVVDNSSVVQAVFRRGLVGEIVLTLTDFMRHAREIFEAAPIEQVHLSDKEPLDDEGVQGYFGGDEHSPPELWHWIESAQPTVTWEVPPALYSLMEGMGHRECMFFSADAANAALSDACVAHGRALAGLPHLGP